MSYLQYIQQKFWHKICPKIVTRVDIEKAIERMTADEWEYLEENEYEQLGVWFSNI